MLHREQAADSRTWCDTAAPMSRCMGARGGAAVEHVGPGLAGRPHPDVALPILVNGGAEAPLGRRRDVDSIQNEHMLSQSMHAI